MPAGTVVRLYSDYADVALDPGSPTSPAPADRRWAEVVVARFRGRLERRTAGERSPLAVGDRVRVALCGQEAVIEEREPRRSLLSRAHPHDEHLEQVIAANVDQVLVVASPVLPPLKPGLLDRYLVAASAAGLPCALAVTKCDLLPPEAVDALLVPWCGTGIRTFRISAAPPDDLQVLASTLLEGHATVMVGQSGVGKTTLRNRLLAGTGEAAATAPVSAKTGRGMHVTTAATLEPLLGGGLLIDTPGVKELTPFGVSRRDLPRHYPEFSGLACRFTDCGHAEEPGCALHAEVEAGRVRPERLISLLALAATLPPR